MVETVIMNPYLIGIVNALFPGLGYLILRKRQIFGALLFIGTLLYIYLTFTEPVFMLEGRFFFAETSVGKIIEAVSVLAFMAAFAYDGYMLANESSSK
jgi:hypothetical protein